MATSIVDMFPVRTQEAILASMFAVAGGYGVDVVGVQAERILNCLFQCEALAKSKEDAIRLQVAQAAFADTVAETGGIWVDWMALGAFNLTRNPATYTTGNAILTCGPTASGTHAGARQVQFQSDSGVAFTNAEAFSTASNITVPLTLVATTSGVSGNVPTGSINTISSVTPLPGCTVSNSGTSGSWLLTSAVASESDAALMARCIARWTANTYGGTLASYRKWVTQAFVAAGYTENPIAWLVVDEQPVYQTWPGSTYVHFADTNENADAPTVAIEQAIIDACLQSRRALGTGPLTTVSCVLQTVSITATFYGNPNAAALAAALLTAFQLTIKPGGTIYWAQIYALLERIPGVRNVALQPLGATTLDYTLPWFTIPSLALVPTVLA